MQSSTNFYKTLLCILSNSDYILKNSLLLINHLHTLISLLKYKKTIHLYKYKSKILI